MIGNVPWRKVARCGLLGWAGLVRMECIKPAPALRSDCGISHSTHHQCVQDRRRERTRLEYSPCFCMTCRNLMTTLEEGRISTCFFPFFSALYMDFCGLRCSWAA